MRKFRKVQALFMAVAMLCALAACASAPTAPAPAGPAAPPSPAAPASPSVPAPAPSGVVFAQRNIKLAHTGNESSVYHKAYTKFAEVATEKSGGAYKLEVFPNTLGPDNELIGAVQIGTVDLVQINSSVLANVTTALGVIDLPFIFSSRQQCYDLLDGPVGDELLKMNEKGCGMISLVWTEGGFRNITNNVRPVSKPEDLKNIKIRSMNSNIHLETWKIWGANPTPMDFSEMITAMQTGVIEGHDNNLGTITANKMWEFQKYISESNHFYGAQIFGASSMFWNKLSDGEKAMIKEVAKEIRDYERELSTKIAADGFKICADNGMEVTYADKVDINAFKDSVKRIWESAQGTVGKEIIDKVVNA